MTGEDASKDTGTSNDTSARLSAELQNLKDQQDITKFFATQQLELAKAQRDLITQLVPAGETKGTAGSVTQEGEGKTAFIAEQIAFYALNKNSDAICRGIIKKLGHSPSTSKILIINQPNFTLDDLPYFDLKAQFDLYFSLVNQQKKIMDKIITPGHPVAETVLLALGLGAAVLSNIADIASYFKTDFTITNLGVTIKNEVPTAAIAGKLADNNISVYVLNNYFLEPGPGEVSDRTTLFGMLNGVNEDILVINQLKGRVNARVEEETKNTTDKPSQEWFNAAAQSIRDADALIAALNAFLKSITTPDTGQPYSRFAMAMLREKIRSMDISHVLYLNVASSGGETQSEKRPLQEIRFSYIAGITLTWMLIRKDGSVAGTETVSYLYQYKCDLASLENSTIIPIQNWEGRGEKPGLNLLDGSMGNP